MPLPFSFSALSFFFSSPPALLTQNLFSIFLSHGHLNHKLSEAYCLKIAKGLFTPGSKAVAETICKAKENPAYINVDTEAYNIEMRNKTRTSKALGADPGKLIGELFG